MTKRCNIMNNIINIVRLLVIAFVCGVIFQSIQMVTFDILGIDKILNNFMVPSLLIIPTTISVFLSYIYYKNRKWIIITGLITLIFALTALNIYKIGIIFWDNFYYMSTNILLLISNCFPQKLKIHLN